MLIWYPDFCPTGGCAVELEKRPDKSTNWDAPKSFVKICPHHAGVKTSNGLDNLGLFKAILQSSRVKEKARWALHVELGLDKDHPGVPYTVNPDGSFTLRTSLTDLEWRTEDGSVGPLPSINASARNRARAAAEAEVAKLERPLGTSTITVE